MVRRSINMSKFEPKRGGAAPDALVKGDYVLATKYRDGDPNDQWGVGFYDRFENKRHFVLDTAGKQLRYNGFRRAGRITSETGLWLLAHAKDLDTAPPGCIDLWGMLGPRARPEGVV